MGKNCVISSGFLLLTILVVAVHFSSVVITINLWYAGNSNIKFYM